MQPQGIWGISRDFSRLSPCGGQVAYALLTRAPVAGRSVAAPPLPLDLHVLSLPLAFILSQDQTLRCCYMFFHFFLSGCRRSAPPPDTGMEGRRSRSRPNRQGEAPKRGLPAFLAILFVSSHDVNVLKPIPYRIADAKVVQLYSIFQIFLTKNYAEKHIFLPISHQSSVSQCVTSQINL